MTLKLKRGSSYCNTLSSSTMHKISKLLIPPGQKKRKNNCKRWSAPHQQLKSNYSWLFFSTQLFQGWLENYCTLWHLYPRFKHQVAKYQTKTGWRTTEIIRVTNTATECTRLWSSWGSSMPLQRINYNYDIHWTFILLPWTESAGR